MNTNNMNTTTTPESVLYRAVLHHTQTRSKVGEADVTINVQKNVVWFNVSVAQK